jgi:hypothetical protein
MSNERPNDFLSWRRTLSQPDALSEHGLEDREISWEKLAERLRDEPRRRWTVYWIAAACLLLALVPVARLFRDHPRAESPRPAALRSTALRQATLRQAPPRPAALRPTALPPAPHPAAAPHSALQETALPTLISSRHNTLTRRPTVATFPRPALLISTPPITPAGPLTAALAELPEAAPPQVPPVRIKKQLRIVNINEITRGANPAPATARREPGFLRIGTTIPDPPGSSSTDDPALLKIKLSQNR